MVVVLALKLHKSSVNPRNANVVESIKVVFIKRIQQSILLQVVEEILELPDDNPVNIPPQPLDSLVVGTAPCYRTRTTDTTMVYDNNLLPEVFTHEM